MSSSMTYRVGFSLALFLALNLPLPAQDAAAQLFQQGMDLYAQKKYLAAVDYLGQVCDMSPANLQARFYLVYSYIGVGKFQDALRHVRVLTEKDPGNMSFQTLKAEIEKHVGAAKAQTLQSILPPKEVEIGGYQVTEPVSRPASMSDSPKPKPAAPKEPKPKPNPAIDAAMEALDSQNFEQAGKLLDEYLAKNPKDQRALHARGVIELQAGKFAESRKWLEKALKEKPNSFDTLFLLGDAFLKENKLKEAEDAFSKALEIKPDPFATINLADTRKRMGKLKEAVETYKKALTLDGNLVDAKTSLADVYLELGKTEDAIDLVNEVLTSEPGNSPAHFVKGKILYRSGLADDAIIELKTAMTESRDNEAMGSFLGRILLSQQKFAEALDVGNEVLRGNPSSWEARLILAEALMMSGDNENANEQLSEAQSVYKGSEVTLMKAKLARKMGEVEKATELYQAYAGAEAANGYAQVEFGQFLEEVGELKGAVAIYKSVKERFPGTVFSAQAESRLTAVNARMPDPPAPAQPEPPKPQPGKVQY